MTLSPRERNLAIGVGVIVFCLLNLALFTAFARKQAVLRAEFAQRKSEWTLTQQLLSEDSLWKQRDDWLTAKQPKITNETTAYVQLLDQMRNLAKKHNVTFENPAAGSPSKTQWYHSVTMNVETRGTWPALIAFLQAAQSPEQFLVFERASIQIDENDPSQMRGSLTIARWYAP